MNPIICHFPIDVVDALRIETMNQLPNDAMRKAHPAKKTPLKIPVANGSKGGRPSKPAIPCLA
jgi:hypothetical protein